MSNMRCLSFHAATFRRIFYFILFTLYFFLSMSFTACGRRGDPVILVPYDGTIVESERGEDRSKDGGEKKEQEDKMPSIPEAPAGLRAVYIGTAVILTWDELSGEGTVLYTIYRSEGTDYTVIGMTQTPAFFDRTIDSGKTYYYKVSARGDAEGALSEGLQITTDEGEQ